MTSEYPYGQFPTRFTKLGQQRRLEKKKIEEQRVSSLSTQPVSSPQQPQQNSFDISKLLPLIKLMGDKKSISTSDMLKMFIPLLGGESSGVSELLSLFPTKEEEPIVEDLSSPPINLDDYIRVE